MMTFRLAWACALLAVSAVAVSAQSRLPLARLGDDTVRIGDMILDSAQIARELDWTGRSRPQGGVDFDVYVSEPWPNGVLPLAFDERISSGQRGRMFSVCRGWEAGTGVRCVERTNESRYVEVTADDEGCSATVGRPRRANGQLNLAEGCWHDSTILHELGHALGLMHEHQRADRDSYVSIDMSNVIEGKEHNYTRFATTRVVTAYDFDSIMHYDPFEFARDRSRRVIEPRPEFAAQGRNMGRAASPSVLDRTALALVYGGGALSGLRFDTHEIHRTMLRLDALYTTELKRSNGLSLGGEPDFSGVATWIFNVYLSGRAGGLGEADAFYNVQALISQSDEWRAKNPNGRPFSPKPVVSAWRLDTGEYLETMYRVSDLYRTELKRPEGLAIGGKPDFSGLATWVVHVYMNARLGGTARDAAWNEVVALIRDSDEWRQKNPGSQT
jgi:hypothetical protein